MANNLQNEHSSNGVAGAKPEGRAINWEALYQDSKAECERLRLELAETRKQRSEYLSAVCAMLPPPDLHFTREEVFASLGQNPSLDEVIEELRRDSDYVKQS